MLTHHHYRHIRVISFHNLSNLDAMKQRNGNIEQKNIREKLRHLRHCIFAIIDLAADYPIDRVLAQQVSDGMANPFRVVRN